MEGAESTMAGAPEQIGSFRIVGHLGSGGMGDVYRAVQDSLHREVALKILHPGRLTPELERRFAVESEVLGRLRHPGIAQVYEAGTYGEGPEARPFFAMELVEGEPVGVHVHRKGLGPRERLELIERIARAIEHAHQRGVIHRDLKPDNVLVDAEGNPKVLDFGVARVSNDDLLAVTMQTGVGQIIGTLPYMSPEQTSGDPAEIDTRCDVYALGVLSYELLVERPPYVLAGVPLTDALRIIRDEEPTLLGRINGALRGDVETIVRKALEKDKERRYPSAASFADDIRRFLENRPIEAHPPSGWYQVVKFTRRHRAIVMGLAGVFLALGAGVIGTSVYAARASQARDDAEAAREDATDVLEYVVETFGRATPEDLGTEARVRDLLDAEAGKVGLRFAERPAVEAELRRTFGKLYAGMTMWPDAELHMRRSLELYRGSFGPTDSRTRKLERSLASLLLRAGNYEEARDRLETLLATYDPIVGDLEERNRIGIDLATVQLRTRQTREAIRSFKGILESDAVTGKARPDWGCSIEVRARDGLGQAFTTAGRFDEAERELRTALALAMEDGGTMAQAARHNLAILLRQLGRNVEAEKLLRSAFEERSLAQGSAHVETAGTMSELAQIYSKQGRLEEAETFARDSLATFLKLEGETAPTTIGARLNVAHVLRQLGRLDESLEQGRRALDAAGDRQDLRTTARAELAQTLSVQGEYVEACAMFEELLDSAQGIPERIVLLENLAMARSRNNQAEEAVALFEEALTLARDEWPNDHPIKASAIHRLAQVRRTQDLNEESAKLHLEALAIRRAVLPADHQDIAASLNDVGFVYLDRNEPKAALPYFEEALEMDRRTLGEETVGTLISTSNLANLYLQLKRFEDAEAILAPTIERVPRVFPETHRFPGVNLMRMGQALMGLERYTEAVDVLYEASLAIEATYGPTHARTRAVRGLLLKAEAAQ